jgi:hypothetical protein
MAASFVINVISLFLPMSRRYAGFGLFANAAVILMNFCRW